MARYLDGADGSRVDSSFQVDYERQQETLAYRVPVDKVNPELADLHSRFVVHYTRACNGPWPDESVVDYYRSVATSEEYPRGALATLLHIAATQRIIGSSRHMPRRTPCVSFTALPVAETVGLMRWRSRYHEMSLEPYGIAISKEVAERIGVRPVTYFDSNHRRPPADGAWCWQSIGQKTDWRAEQEWRARGDINLSDVPIDAVRLVCHTPEEAWRIREITGYVTIAITR